MVSWPRMAVDDLRSGTWVTYVGGRATSVRVRRCRLEVAAGPDAGLVRDIESNVIRIGARRGNDVQLSDAKVSGLHCEIRLDERGYRLRDLDSTNGTYVGGLRINDVYIQPGAQIAVGGTRLREERVAVAHGGERVQRLARRVDPRERLPEQLDGRGGAPDERVDLLGEGAEQKVRHGAPPSGPTRARAA